MAKKQQEMYDGRPVFVASSSKKLAEAVAKYDGKVEPPYVVKISNRAKDIRECAFEYDNTVGVVIIPDSVSKIGNSAFHLCRCLTDVVIPASVTVIDYGAFSFCDKLTNIIIPDSVRKIAGNAFCACSALTSIEIPASLSELCYNPFEGCGNLTSIKVKDGNPKYDSREDCNAIIESETNTLVIGCKNTVIPDSVRKIRYYAFSGCSALTSIEIPASLSELEKRPFLTLTMRHPCAHTRTRGHRPATSRPCAGQMCRAS